MPTNSKEYMKANYAKYWGNPKAVAARSLRNKARRIMEKRGLVKKGDGMEVDHIHGTGKGNGSSNLRVITRLRNRVLGQKKAVRK